MHSEPCGECDDAFQFMVPPSGLSNGGVASHHGHDTHVEVAERLSRLARDVGGNVSN
jgi:hypothetical protein